MTKTAVHPSESVEQAKDARADELLDAERENGKPAELAIEVLTLPQKLLKVAGEIPEIDKDGHNDFQNYDFASAENVLRKVRVPLAAEGVLLLSNLLEITERQTKTPKGKDTVITTVRVHFAFIDTETGDKLESTWAGTGDDPSDKGLYKAYTGCIKTFLRSTFLLPLGDDPEADERADERATEEPELPKIERIDGVRAVALFELAQSWVEQEEDEEERITRRKRVATLIGSEGGAGDTVIARIASLTPVAADKVESELNEWKGT